MALEPYYMWQSTFKVNDEKYNKSREDILADNIDKIIQKLINKPHISGKRKVQVKKRRFKQLELFEAIFLALQGH
ncbi:MAG: hypothetical protein ACTSYS_12170 [Promethearchaeota archaeon]